MTKRNIKSGWAATGLFPFNPERVLRDAPKPIPEATVLNDVVESSPQDGMQQMPAMPVTPITPVTPVTIKSLTSLYNLIEQETCELNEPSKKRIKKHVQKLASAAQIFFAKKTLLQDQNRFLNNEAKVRRSTKSVALRKAKVMSYEDLEKARAKHAAKEEAIASAGKRGRKRKNPTPGAVALEPMAKLMRMSEVQEPAAASFRAPVARMH